VGFEERLPGHHEEADLKSDYLGHLEEADLIDDCRGISKKKV